MLLDRCFGVLLGGCQTGNVLCLFNVQLPRLAVLADPAVIVYAVGGIGVLLYLGDQYALADSVQRACLDKEHISLVNGNIVCDLEQRIVRYPFGELLFAYLVLEAVQQLCALVAVNDIPHLGLAVLALDPLCVLVVRVYLDREIVLRIDKLYKYREELEPVAVRAENALAVPVDILLKGQPLILSRCNGGWTVLVTGKLPAFGDLIVVAFFAEVVS